MGTDQLEQTGAELWEQIPGGPQLGQIEASRCWIVGKGWAARVGIFRLLTIAIYRQDGNITRFLKTEMVSLVHAPVHGKLGSIKTLFHLVNYPLYGFTEWDPIVSMPSEVTLHVSLLSCCTIVLPCFFFHSPCSLSHRPRSPLVETEILSSILCLFESL